MQMRGLAVVIAAVIFSGLVSVSSPGIDEASAATLQEFVLGLGAGYRQDDFRWNIAGDVDVLSELEWSDLEIFQLQGTGKLVLSPAAFPAQVCFRSGLGYGVIFDGKNRDSDYAGNNRTLEFSRSESRADEGNVLDASAGGGLQFPARGGKLTLAALAGYSYHEQNLTITDGVQTVSAPAAFTTFAVVPAPLGPLPGLDSTYEARWRGPWIGLDLTLSLFPAITIDTGFEYHWAVYQAEGNWNLRSDLAHPRSFDHRADGRGKVAFLAGRYNFNERLAVALRLDYQDWSTDPGTSKTFFADGSTGRTRLNEVEWESLAASLGLVFRFI
jgi:hypothetical protein